MARDIVDIALDHAEQARRGGWDCTARDWEEAAAEIKRLRAVVDAAVAWADGLAGNEDRADALCDAVQKYLQPPATADTEPPPAGEPVEVLVLTPDNADEVLAPFDEMDREAIFGPEPPSNPSASMFRDRTDEHDARRDAETAEKRCGNCAHEDVCRDANVLTGEVCDDWQPAGKGER